MKLIKIVLLSTLLLACNTENSEKKTIAPPNDRSANGIADPLETTRTILTLNLDQANRLLQLPIHCVNTEYPNKLNQTIGGDEDLKSPKELHPTFYGCFDWHSSVHGHWSLVSLLKKFPNLKDASKTKEILLTSISKENIEKEVAYFNKKYNKSYERTYGWAWLLKLAEELHTWNDPIAKELEQNLQPLTDLMVQKYIEFLPRLKYPIRVGEHPNTAFGLAFAWDYATTVGDKKLVKIINNRAKDYFMNDKNCPISWEPSGFDFLSACLQEAAIMKRVLPKNEFKNWLSEFLPKLKNKDFKLAVGEVLDRTDGKLVHLDGVNFSRAWCLNKIANDLPEYNHLKNVANKHINYSLPNVVGDNYEGGHWLGSFAIYALNSTKND
tara:strand:+ start:1181 stop:2326 length:1146 start_codon:yes stop_codon:yes gene_type:complete